MSKRLMCGPSPWRKVLHEGFEWMVRENAGVVWVVRLPDRATWMLDAMPEWADPNKPKIKPMYRARPSSLALIVACHASLLMQESVPPLPETDEEAEGTAGHWVARRMVAGYGHELPVGAKFHSGGREWAVDMDMFSGAVMYARALGAPHPTLQIERTMPIERIHPTECGGTPDAWNYFPDAREAYGNECPSGVPPELFHSGQIKLIRVGDYKYGHRFVEVFENHQLVSYAGGIIDALYLTDTDPTLYVEMILVQPRSYHRDGPVRVWRVRADQLRNLLITENDAVGRALADNLGGHFAPMATTGRHCLDCKARHVCGALQVNVQSLVDFAHTAERTELPALALGQELAIVDDALKRLEARQTGLAAQAEALLRAGQAVPFYHMEPGQSRLTYFDNVNVDELVGLGDLVGINLRRPQERKDLVVTPTQAIQLGIDAIVMDSYADRPPGKTKLTRDSAIIARKVFAK